MTSRLLDVGTWISAFNVLGWRTGRWLPIGVPLFISNGSAEYMAVQVSRPENRPGLDVVSQYFRDANDRFLAAHDGLNNIVKNQ